MTGRGQDSRQRTIVIAAVAVLLALVGVAWLLEYLAADDPRASSVRVTRDGRQIAVFDMDELRGMETERFDQLGETEEGPPVLAVLERAGVTDFERLTVIGLGVRDDGTLVLDRDAVTSEVVLDFATTRETVKIAGPDITRDERVRDVTELRVE